MSTNTNAQRAATGPNKRLSDEQQQARIRGMLEVGQVLRERMPDVAYNARWEQGIIVGQVSCDWLTITSWSLPAFRQVVQFIGLYAPDEGKGSNGKIQQYAGISGTGWFAGIGYQQSMGVWAEHYYIRLSGAVAHQFLSQALVDGGVMEALSQFNCPRIDVQYTLPDETPNVDLGESAKEMRTLEWGNPWRRPRIDCYDREDTLSTIYIGHRSSARVQRIYRKSTGSSELLRWETEYKDRLAALLWQRIQAVGRIALQSALSAEIASAPVTDQILALFATLEGEQDRLTVTKETTDSARRLKWLLRVVVGCSRKLVEDMSRPGAEAEIMRSEFARFLAAIEEHATLAEERYFEQQDQQE